MRSRSVAKALVVFGIAVQPLWAAIPAVTLPQPDDVVFTLNAKAAPSLLTKKRDSDVVGDASGVAPLSHVSRLFEQFAVTADPRLLGQIQRHLELVEPAARDGRYFLLRARLRQTLHDFDSAEADLTQAAAEPETRKQALLMMFNTRFVQGDADGAADACDALQVLGPDLYTASCRAQLQAVTSSPKEAFLKLKSELARRLLDSDVQARAWALATAADIAERDQQLSTAESLWHLALKAQSTDLYARARLCRNLLIQAGREDDVLSLTEGYTFHDDLAVCRARALRDSEAAEALVEELQARFAEARWRGEVLHKRAYAQFLLHIENDRDAALLMANENWQSQREWPDEQILIELTQSRNSSSP